MTVNPALCRHLLQVLTNLRGNALPGTALLFETECRAGRPISSEEFHDLLSLCKNSGWIATRRDDFDRDVWWITESGKNKAATFQ